MSTSDRRGFLRRAAGGLAVSGSAALVLRADAQPTPTSPDADEAQRVLADLGPEPKERLISDKALVRTDERSLGPFYRPGAPFRGKVSRPFAEGIPMVVTGRVWAVDTRRPLPGTLLDIWQVDNATRTYSEGAKDADYSNRARLVCSETGAYEFETVHPVWYTPNPQNPNFVRAPHIHFIATHPGYKRLVSEIFFEGDEKQDVDPLFLASLRTQVRKEETAGRALHRVVFDIVLEPA